MIDSKPTLVALILCVLIGIICIIVAIFSNNNIERLKNIKTVKSVVEGYTHKNGPAISAFLRKILSNFLVLNMMVMIQKDLRV